MNWCESGLGICTALYQLARVKRSVERLMCSRDRKAIRTVSEDGANYIFGVKRLGFLTVDLLATSGKLGPTAARGYESASQTTP